MNQSLMKENCYYGLSEAPSIESLWRALDSFYWELFDQYTEMNIAWDHGYEPTEALKEQVEEDESDIYYLSHWLMARILQEKGPVTLPDSFRESEFILGNLKKASIIKHDGGVIIEDLDGTCHSSLDKEHWDVGDVYDLAKYLYNLNNQ